MLAFDPREERHGDTHDRRSARHDAGDGGRDDRPAHGGAEGSAGVRVARERPDRRRLGRDEVWEAQEHWDSWFEGTIKPNPPEGIMPRIVTRELHSVVQP